MNSVGEAIREIRVKKGLTGKFISSQVGVTPSALSKYENNDRKVPAELLPSFAEALGCKVDDFFAEKIGETPTVSGTA